jgi:hypothetical protein
MKVYRCFLLSAAAACALSLGVPTAAARPDAAAPLATVRGEQYTIDVTTPPVSVGADAEFQVKVAATGGFKFNQAFPTKLKLGDAPDGLVFPKPKLKKGDGVASADGKSFTFAVPVKATRAGQFPFEAVLKFSVCNDDKCVVQRKKLKSRITAQ